jgi:branched-subunit amino acid ABC-type transport system permease component
MSTVATIVLNGLVLGMVLVLMATGLTIIFGMLDVVNFAHGSLYMVSAYVTLFVATRVGGLPGFFLAVALAALVALVVGVGLHYALERPSFVLYAFALTAAVYAWDLFGLTVSLGVGVASLAAVYVGLSRTDRQWQSFYDRSHLFQIMYTFGIALLLDGSVEMVAGPDFRSVSIPAALQGSTDLLGFTYPTYRIMVVVLTVVVMALAGGFLTYTRYGQIIRAGVTEPDMVRLLGVDLDRAFVVVFALGAVLAGLAGALMAPLRSVHPQMGVGILVQSFVVIVIGGIGNIRNMAYAGLLVGILMSLMGTYYSAATDVIVFVSMVAVLLVRPQGLFSDAEGAV